MASAGALYGLIISVKGRHDSVLRIDAGGDDFPLQGIEGQLARVDGGRSVEEVGIGGMAMGASEEERKQRESGDIPDKLFHLISGPEAAACKQSRCRGQADGS